MNWFYDLRIATKLISAFILVALIGGLIGYEGIGAVRSIDQSYTDMVQNNTKLLGDVGRVAVAYQQLRVNIRDFFVDDSAEKLLAHAARKKEIDKLLNESLGKLEKAMTTAEKRQDLNNLREDLNKLDPLLESIIRFAIEGKKQEAMPIMRGEALKLANSIQGAIEKLFEVNISEAEKVAAQNNASTSETVKFLGILAAFGVLIAICLGFFISRIISRPLRNLAAVADRLAAGDMNVLVEVKTKDETGSLSQSFNKIIKAVSALTIDANMLVQAAIEGRLATRADANKHEGDYRKIVEGVNNTLDAVIGPLSVAGKYVEQISKGDIPPRITDEYRGDFNEIKNNLNMLIENLTNFATEIQGSSDQVTTMSGMLSSSAEQLSQGATEQAASVEEVSSSVEEMSANIHQSAG